MFIAAEVVYNDTPVNCTRISTHATEMDKLILQRYSITTKGG
jgi:hypothetical protein